MAWLINQVAFLMKGLKWQYVTGVLWGRGISLGTQHQGRYWLHEQATNVLMGSWKTHAFMQFAVLKEPLVQSPWIRLPLQLISREPQIFQWHTES